MSEIITYTACPFCKSDNIIKVLTAKDNTVSQKDFDIWHCNNCSGRFTQHIPGQEDIGAYYKSNDYISHSDVKKGFINRLYHIVRNYTLQSKKKLLNQVNNNSKGALLDIGAGTGAFANTMKLDGWQVTALEPDDVARENALKNYGLQLQTPDTLYNLPENSFNVITMWHVLEHVHDLHGYIDTFHRILESNGTLIIAVPNYTSYDAEKYGQYWAAYDVPRHLYHFSPDCMQRLMQSHGFTVTNYIPMWFDSFYVSMLSEQYKNGKSNMVGAVSTALASNRKAWVDAKKCSSVIYVIKKAQSPKPKA
ncbi:class I SAM-dependent methyltransferase [Danxiaibacter flavus]|uniref:Class I SAM-dependent methyltransferase n=1 Tax=Danxiaibacter flavus TaxID=3049108 RepID=A0ABV3ZKV4_9BACT|nr:class I SAM-dependent methyltransferase [Chitinophagaceae bacterium DXS]